MNQLIISGNVGNVGEPKQIGDTTLSEVSIAWNNPRKKDAEPMWVRVKLFGKQADLVRYIRKGDRLTVSGRLEIETWEKDGQTRFAVVCVANEIDLPPKSEGRDDSHELRETPIAERAPRNAPLPQRQAARR